MYKIVTYTICKNEISHVEDWYNSAKEADGIYILDTGSTDGTLEKLKELEKSDPKFHLYEKSYEIFSFGDAWNTILDKVPEDVDFVVRIDMDQYFLNRYWYFELQVWLMHHNVNPKDSCNLHITMYEKNFDRLESHPAIFSTNVRWAGDIHEREYFPGVEEHFLRDDLVPLTIYHNQKYPTTNNTGIPGCQKRYDFYQYLAKEQFKKTPTVFNFIHYLMIEDDITEALYKVSEYELGFLDFEKCDKLTTYGADFKPQLIDALSAIYYTFMAENCLLNYLDREQTDPMDEMSKASVPYTHNLIERAATEILHKNMPVDRLNSIKDILEIEKKTVKNLSDRIQEVLSNYR